MAFLQLVTGHIRSEVEEIARGNAESNTYDDQQ